MVKQDVSDSAARGTAAVLARSVFVDLEIHPKTQLLLKIGAWKPSQQASFYRQGHFHRAQACQELLAFIQGSDFIIGHNIAEHDWPYLCQWNAAFEPLGERLMDTLVLNPLAFPTNPYHRLVKDYKLQRESINDPVADCQQTEKLLRDQCEAFAKQPLQSGLFALLLAKTSAAYPVCFNLILNHPITGKRSKQYIEACLNKEAACQRAKEVVAGELRSNDAERQRTIAYALAWLQSAGANSVLHPWVWHQHPGLPGILDKLRHQPCLQADCDYCRTHHDPEKNLFKFFSYKTFRHFGSEKKKEPLQRQIVMALIRDEPTLAVLPTGGGKSLCYQLPAMMKARNRGQLSMVISPLQSLMNDQVQQLQQRGYPYVASLNGSLTMPERQKVLEGIRMGDVHLLYIAPEQLRNSSFIASLQTREIAQWVIDEAHCLSKWGHDFRPDYLYITRFIAEFAEKQGKPIPPVHAFTATARLEVVDEILAHMAQRLGARPQVMNGGHQRHNLHYRVLACPASEKREQVLNLLENKREALEHGTAIVFCNRRQYTQEMSNFLTDNGWRSDYFHAGRDSNSKRSVQQAFMDGELDVIAATNAFGMGVDKSNVRLVIHAHMPDSLENYLQEAGRAGRDGEDADCVLLFDEADVDKQFEMRRNQQIEFRDLLAVFEAVRHRSKVRLNEKTGVSESVVYASSGDLLRAAYTEEQEVMSFDSEDRQYDTKVRTAIAWLVEAGFLDRRENHTGVIEGSFNITDMTEIRQHLQAQRVSASKIEQWMKVVRVMMQCDLNESINMDQLAEQSALEPRAIRHIVDGLRGAGVMNADMSLVAWVKAYVAGDSRKQQAFLCVLEMVLLDLIREAAQGDVSSVFQLNLVHTCHALREVVELPDTTPPLITPPLITQLLSLWTRQDKVLRTTPLGRDMHRLTWLCEFEQVERNVKQRQACCKVSLEHLYSYIPKGEKGYLRVPFQLGKLEGILSAHDDTRHLDKLDMRTEQSLLALQHNHLIGLESGAAIFHTAMSLHIPKGVGKPGRRVFRPLETHYKAQIRQVHVMREWAVRMADGQCEAAHDLLRDYFDLTEKRLMNRYFSQQSKQDMETPASPHRVQSIVGESALSATQMAIVKQPADKNILVLAGPGSGKTRVIVHRVAWLVGVQREAPESVMVLAFNRSTVTEMRQRLMQEDMLGRRAWRVQIHTYHSLAMRLLGELPPDDADDFQVWSSALMDKATALLEGGVNHDELTADDAIWQQLMAGFRFILVDEYQDMNQIQYAFLSALAGRVRESEAEQLSMFAVGDDDQNIYEWNGAKNHYIHKFSEDYHADMAYMTENYRSCSEVVRISQAFISYYPDTRLKENYPIVAANMELSGGVYVYKGSKAALYQKALAWCWGLLKEQSVPADEVAILFRHHQDYQILAARLRSYGLPICLVNQKQPYRWDRLREVHQMLRVLDGEGTQTAASIRQAWLGMPAYVREHRSVQPLWQWLAAHEASDHIVRSKQEWRSEVWELSKVESRKTGQGVWLGTMHSTKGLEFEHVMVFGGDKGGSLSEEIRLRYVAMTRAKQNLLLMQDDAKWFDRLPLDIESLDEEVRESHEETDVYICGMKDMDMDFFGRLSSVPDIATMREGDALTWHPESGKIFWQAQAVGRFSQCLMKYIRDKTKQGWSVERVIVHAVLWRQRDDIRDESYAVKCRQREWYVVLPEVDLKQLVYG